MDNDGCFDDTCGNLIQLVTGRLIKFPESFGKI